MYTIISFFKKIFTVNLTNYKSIFNWTLSRTYSIIRLHRVISILTNGTLLYFATIQDKKVQTLPMFLHQFESSKLCSILPTSIRQTQSTQNLVIFYIINQTKYNIYSKNTFPNRLNAMNKKMMMNVNIQK
jgi:hypothetical protein